MAKLAAITPLYATQAFYDEPNSFFIPPEKSAGRSSRVRSYEGWGEVIDLSWKSTYAPFLDEMRERYARHEENALASARLFLHRDPSPAVILVHGYLGGTFAIEERFWPVKWLFEQGLDVALAVLPFHGQRKRSQVARPVFPSSDPRFTIEGFRQAVHDLRWLQRWLGERGALSVGVMGMSLGGYTTALLSTIEPTLSFAVPLIPLASLADFARDGGRLVGTSEEQRAQHEAIETAHRVVSPFARPCLLPPDRVLVIGGEHDRITPIEHAQRLAQHLGGPLETFAGGHLFQLGRGDAFRVVERLIDHVKSSG